jgi:hypothetical protein
VKQAYNCSEAGMLSAAAWARNMVIAAAVQVKSVLATLRTTISS